MKLADVSIHAWIAENEIKNEKGERIDFENHLFLYDIYADQHANVVGLKAAQVGFSTLEVLKNIFDAKKQRMDIIYTLPTDSDVNVFVGGKVNRIISNNPILLDYVADKDSIEQKQISSGSMVYFRGTWTKKAAIMVTADRLVHDEKDSSKQDVVLDYQARLQHSKYKQTHVFSHPSVPNNGVDVEWRLSDMKEWFITCPHCRYEQFLSWNTEDPKQMSVDIEKRIFICKKCHGELGDADRAIGRWLPRKRRLVPAAGAQIAHYVGKHANAPGKTTCDPATCREWSGYHVSLLMAPWISAAEVIDKYNDPKQTKDFFFNKVLGVAYAGSGNAVTQDTILGSITTDKNAYKGRIVIGVDTGVDLRYVIGNRQGLLGYGQMKAYEPDTTLRIPLEESLEYFLKKFENSVMVIDQGGDIIGPRKLRAKYPGRVFLCHYARDRKTMQLIRWGEKDESGNVLVDRNRIIQLVIDEFKDKRVKLYNGTLSDWYDYWLHWSHIYRVRSVDELGIMRSEWLRSDRDDWVHATVYWRVGMDRFAGTGSVIGASDDPMPNSYFLNPDGSATFNPDEMFRRPPGGLLTEELTLDDDNDDWR